MTLDLTCQACDTSFELDLAELLDEPRVQCPGCDARVPRALAEGLSEALDGLFTGVAQLAPKFQLVFQVDSEDLPPPYDHEPAARAEDEEEAGELDEDDDDDEDDDEDLDDEDLEGSGSDAD